MVYLSYFIHSWLVFVTPLKILHRKTTIKQQVIFTIIYGFGIIFVRSIYSFFRIPFGTHTVLLIIVGVVLVKNILKDFDWQKSVYTILISVIILLINDSIILLPTMKLFDLTVIRIEKNKVLLFIMTGILSNLLLILVYFAFVVRDLTHNYKKSR